MLDSAEHDRDAARGGQAERAAGVSPAWALGAFALAAALAALVFAPSLHGGFVSDDVLYLEHSPILELPLSAALPRIFGAPYFANYSPLHQLLLYVEWQAFGLSPLGYRITNVLLQAGVTCALAAAARRGGLSARGACIATALFLVHPAAVEAVAWITQSKTLLALGLALLSLERWLAHLDSPSVTRLALALGAGALALLAKSAVVLLPAVFAVAWWTHGRGGCRDRFWVAAFGLFGLGVLWLNLWAQATQGGVVHWFGGSRETTALILPWVLWRYVRLALLPFDPVHLVHPDPVSGWTDVRLVLPLAGLVAAALVAVLAVRRDRRAGLAVAWILAGLAPVVQLVPMTTVFADRYLYVALPGFLTLAAAGADAALAGARGASRAAAWAALALVVITLATVSARQASLWAEPQRLYEIAVAAYPGGPAGWTGLGAERQRSGDLDGAAAAYQRALALEPDDGHVLHLLARVRLAQGRQSEALWNLEASARIGPNHPDIAWTERTARRLRALGVQPVADRP